MQPEWKNDLPQFPRSFHEAYELLDLLGEGGMGRVYLARQKQLDREVAIKVLKSLGESDATRFAREAHVLAGMAHPRIVRVFDSGIGGGVSYLVMERITCATLERRLRQHPLTLRESLRVCARVADALGYAHAEGVVHRDVKPDNVFLTDDLDVKLADFGLAREVLGAQITASGTMMGTPEYMSPEQVNAKAVGPASDQYSLGVVLYRLITQQYPFTGENPITIAMARLRGPAPAPRTHCPTLPQSVDALVMKTLAMRPPDRFATMEEFHSELDRLADSLGPEGDRVFRPPVRTAGRIKVLAPAQPAEETAELPARARTWPWVCAGVLIIVASFGAAWKYGAARARPVVALPNDAAPSVAPIGARLERALSQLEPLARIEDLRRIERELRYSRVAPDFRRELLKPRWAAEFDGRVTELELPAAWAAFAPLEEEFLTSTTDAHKRLSLLNLLEDFSFLSLGLKRLGLPGPFTPSPVRDRARGMSAQPVVPMTAGAGFRLARRTRGDPLDLKLHADSGAELKIDPVSRVADRELDDRFFATAVALGSGNEVPSVLDSIMKADNKVGKSNRVEYAHPVPIAIPDRIEALGISAFVSDLYPEHRFEVYLDPHPDGPFTRRVATFRDRNSGTAQLWHMVDPALVPESQVYLKVKFVILPGQANNIDHAELHQLTLHWRAR